MSSASPRRGIDCGGSRGAHYGGCVGHAAGQSVARRRWEGRRGDRRRRPRTREWLGAAHTVTTGAGDRAAASERIDQEVKPFVDNDIRADWLTAMRSAMAAVMELYDAATAELTAEPDAVFDVPGDLGPSWTPPPRDDEVATVPAAASAVAPPVAAPHVVGCTVCRCRAALPPAPMPPPPVPPVDAGSTAPAMAAPPSAPSLGGLPDVGSGLSGLGQQLADAFGSLLGSADEGLADTPDIDEPTVEDVDDELDDDEPEDDDESVEPAADPEEDPAAEEPVSEPGVEADEPANRLKLQSNRRRLTNPRPRWPRCHRCPSLPRRPAPRPPPKPLVGSRPTNFRRWASSPE